jgi:hypothetical protein
VDPLTEPEQLTSPDLGDDEEDEITQPSSLRLAPFQVCSCEEALALRDRLKLIHSLTEWDGKEEGARARLEHIARLTDLNAAYEWLPALDPRNRHEDLQP